MSLDSRQAVAVRILLDPAYRERFYAPEASPEAHGLTPTEFSLMRRIDASKVAASAEGYAWKARERLASIFPRTMEILDQVTPSWLAGFIESAPLGAEEAVERAAFLSRLREGSPGWDTDVQRLLEDLADLEIRLRLAPDPPRLSNRPGEDARLRLSMLLLLTTRGPLDEVFHQLPNLPGTYPATPRLLMAVRHGTAWRLLAATNERLLLLAACDGTRSMRTIARELPHVNSALQELEDWMQGGVLAEALQGNAGIGRESAGNR